MCGASSEQYQVQAEQMAAYQQIQTMTAEQYQNQQAIFKPMADRLKSIFDLGPNQRGMSDGERNDLNARAVTGTAENYNQAGKALGKTIAAGGGDLYAPTGADEARRGDLASSAAQEESREETQIDEADYEQGHSDWEHAGQGLLQIAAGEDPLGYISNETSSGRAASDTANQIAQEENSWVNAALGAVGTAAGGWASGGFKKP